MKKLNIVASFVIFSFFFLTIPSAVMAVKLTYSNFFPPTHIQSILAEEWCKEVEKATGGEVTVQYYPGGTLTKAPGIFTWKIPGSGHNRPASRLFQRCCGYQGRQCCL